MLDRMNRAFLAGMKAALQLAGIVSAGLLLCPVFVVGIAYGMARTAFLAGINASEDYFDWLTGDFREWRVRLVRDGDSGEGES